MDPTPIPIAPPISSALNSIPMPAPRNIQPKKTTPPILVPLIFFASIFLSFKLWFKYKYILFIIVARKGFFVCFFKCLVHNFSRSVACTGLFQAALSS